MVMVPVVIKLAFTFACFVDVVVDVGLVVVCMCYVESGECASCVLCRACCVCVCCDCVVSYVCTWVSGSGVSCRPSIA